MARFLQLHVWSQLLMFLTQLGYVWSLRRACDRQQESLRADPLGAVAWGWGLVLAWAALLYAAFHLAAVNGSAAMLALLTVPAFLGYAAGGAIGFSAAAGYVLKQDPRERPYLCLLVGQLVPVVAAFLGSFGPVFLMLFVAAGMGAAVRAELKAQHQWEGPRLGYGALIGMVVLTAALSIGLYRAGKSMQAQATQDLQDK